MFMVLGRKKKINLYFVAKEQKMNHEGVVTSHKLFKVTTVLTPLLYLKLEEIKQRPLKKTPKLLFERKSCFYCIVYWNILLNVTGALLFPSTKVGGNIVN